MDSQCRVGLCVLTRFLRFSNQNRSVSWIPCGCRERCSRVLMVGSLPSSSIVSPQWPPSGASLNVLSCRLSWCSSDYARVPSAARWTVCMYRERHKWCMPYYDVANLVTVTKINIIRRNAMWLCKNHCRENMASSLPQSCAAVLDALAVSHGAAQRSQLLSKSPADLRRGLRSSKIWLFY